MLIWFALDANCAPLFLAELLNWYHGAHAESERCFVLAPKVASDPNVQQLGTTNKVAFPFSSTIVQRPNGLGDNCRNRVGFVAGTGVAERWNCTLKDMMSKTYLLESLQGEAIKTALYILNRVPIKSVLKIPFELWTGRKPSLNHFHVWGCLAKVRIYNLSKRKTEPRSTHCYFIGYSDRSKGKIKRFEARLMAKGFTQREGIDFNESFSPVSSKDSFRIIMALVAHFDLELYQMDAKTMS